MPGRRLSDGAPVREPRKLSRPVLIAALIVLCATCPSHDSFAAHLTALGRHPSGLLGGLASLMEGVHIALAAESTNLLLVRVARFRGEAYLGLCASWVRSPVALDVPALPALPRWAALREPWELVCSRGRSPHEAFVLLCVAGFVLWQLYPRLLHRHAVCSLRAVRAGRVHVLLTANLAHANPYHLLHNALQLLHFGPVLRAALGCERLAQLLGAACLCASAASLLWHGVWRARPAEGSVGASGVALALAAANATIYPDYPVRLFGIEMSAAHQLFCFLALDVLAARDADGALDVSAHAGGAACGWALARHWRAGAWF